jgi:hypothetical protein
VTAGKGRNAIADVVPSRTGCDPRTGTDRRSLLPVIGGHAAMDGRVGARRHLPRMLNDAITPSDAQGGASIPTLPDVRILKEVSQYRDGIRSE